MERLLITGGAGSIGRELALSFVTRGYSVVAFDIPVADFSELEKNGIQAIRGDITDPESVSAALKDVDIVVHLAAMLPPASEGNREKTFAVNSLGTKNLVDAIAANGGRTRLIFSSTVASYGDTTAEVPPVTSTTPQRPNSIYSESKVEAEGYVLAAGIPYTILRVSGVMLAALMDPPAWPFVAEQRVEFVYRADVVGALAAAVENSEATNKILIIAGGKSWQMFGKEFAARFLKVLDYPIEDVEYPEAPVYSDWYDTEEAQRILNYQGTSFERYLEVLEEAIEEALS